MNEPTTPHEATASIPKLQPGQNPFGLFHRRRIRRLSVWDRATPAQRMQMQSKDRADAAIQAEKAGGL